MRTLRTCGAPLGCKTGVGLPKIHTTHVTVAVLYPPPDRLPLPNPPIRSRELSPVLCMLKNDHVSDRPGTPYQRAPDSSVPHARGREAGLLPYGRHPSLSRHGGRGHRMAGARQWRSRRAAAAAVSSCTATAAALAWNAATPVARWAWPRCSGQAIVALVALPCAPAFKQPDERLSPGQSQTSSHQ